MCAEDASLAVYQIWEAGEATRAIVGAERMFPDIWMPAGLSDRFRVEIVRKYLSLTGLWPQRRWVISAGLSEHICAQVNPIAALAEFNRMELGPQEVGHILGAMYRVHRTARIGRLLKGVDVENDWLNTKGAVYRQLLSFENKIDVLGSSDYRLLLDPEMVVTLGKIRDWGNLRRILAAALQAPRSNIGLSQLFRLGFMTEMEIEERLEKCAPRYLSQIEKYIGEQWCIEKLAVDSWRELGRLVSDCLVCSGMMPDASWILWGFPDLE